MSDPAETPVPPAAPRQPLTVILDPAREAAARAKADEIARLYPTKPPAAADAQPAPTGATKLDALQRKLLEGQVIKAICKIYDPEIPVNIYELGLIYQIDVDETAAVKVKMTLTAPACPVAGSLPGEVERQIEAIPDVRAADVELVWDPPWTRDRMSEVARVALDMF